MAGIGEASAVIAVVQVGFSLARTLGTYIGDYKDSRDSIIGLAGQLETTILHVRELNTLVRSSEAAGSVSADSRKVAENAVTNSKRLIKKLVKLLTKADLPDNPDAIIGIKPEDIDIRTLTRLYWPRLKPKVDVVNLELQSMRTEILLARSCIQAQTGSTAAERAAGADSIVALTKSKILARRLLKEAKAEERRAEEKRAAAAMSSQQPSHTLPTPPGRNKPSARFTPGPYRSGTYDSISDDGRATDLMAHELRESILEDFQRKDAERKAKQIAEGVARKMAIEDYQRTVKAKLDRLHKARETTQRRMKELFGPNLNEDLVKEFLDEQQSGQMQDEDREMMLMIGAVSQLPPMEVARDAASSSVGKNSAQKPRRRWFFKRHSSRSSASTDTSNNAASIVSSGLSSSEHTQFLHVIMSYDAIEGKYSYQALDNHALRHQPCGPTCDFNDTLRAWQTLPRSAKQAASRWVNENFSDRIWNLHAALPVQKDIRTTRKLLQKAILGAIAHQDMASVMLVFSSTEEYASSETDSTAVAGGSVSGSSHTHGLMSDGGISRVELSQTDVEQMREWLTAKGLSTAKIAELESLVAKQKESAASGAATQPSKPTHGNSSRQDDGTGYDLTDGSFQADISRQGSGSHVRFVTGDVAPLMRKHSNTTATASKGSNTYSSMYPVSQERSGAYPTDSYSYPWNPPSRRSTRNVNNNSHGIHSRRIAEQRRDLDELHRIAKEDESAYQRQPPQDYRPRSPSHNTRLGPRSSGNRYQEYIVHKRTTDHDPTRVVYGTAYQEPNVNLSLPIRNPFGANYRGYRIPSSAHHPDLSVEEATADHFISRTVRSPSTSSTRSSFSGDSWAVLSHDADERITDTEATAAGGRRSARYDKKSSGSVIEREVRSERARRSTSPHPVRMAKRPSLAYSQKHELLTSEPLIQRSDGSRGRAIVHQYHYGGHADDYHPDGGYAYDPDGGNKRQLHPNSMPTPRFFDSIPRELSPKPMLDDASDDEDAALDDTELKNKMLVKYTGGLAGKTFVGTDRMGDKTRGPDTEGGLKTTEVDISVPAPGDDLWGGFGTVGKKKKKGRKNGVDPKPPPPPPIDEPEPESPVNEPVPPPPVDEPASTNHRSAEIPTPTSPVPGVRRHNTVTVEDYESDAGTGTRCSTMSPRRPTSSPSSASSARNSPVIESRPLKPRTINSPPDRDTVEEVD